METWANFKKLYFPHWETNPQYNYIFIVLDLYIEIHSLFRLFWSMYNINNHHDNSVQNNFFF